MSRTETLLLVILGFSLATLIALFFGRLVWAAGLRVGARRMRKQVPSTLVELQTERDRLRAEYAMLSQRLSARLEDARLKLAEQTAEISRYRNRLEGLEADNGGSRTEPAPRSSTEQKLRDELRAVSMQLESALAVQSELQDTLARRRNEQPAAPDQPAARTRSTPEPQPEPEPKSDPQPAPETADVDSDRRLRTHIERLNALASSVARDRADQHQEEVAFRSRADSQR